MASIFSAMGNNAAPAIAVPQRVQSVDALRGLVMFTMIFVNDLAGAGKVVPDWMVHFSDRHHGGSGMTFVDLVFPAFLFIVGMSIPIALSGRLAKGEPVWKLLLHVIVRTVSLLIIGILMVNGESHPSAKEMGLSKNTWTMLMFASALLAFCSISPPSRSAAGTIAKTFCRGLTLFLRALGAAGLIWAACVYRNGKGTRIISLEPFSIHSSWYGILGLIGWSYLVAAIVFLIFRTNRTAILGCVFLLLCLFAADQKGAFEGFWLSRVVGIGDDLGSLASISTAGVLLGTLLLTPETDTNAARSRFTLLFIAGFVVAAMLVTPLWGISKNNATPAWCLWASAITAALWLLFYFIADVWRVRFITKPLSIAGQNVLLAYLLSEMQESVFNLLGWDDWYEGLAGPHLANAIGRSVGCAVFILCLTALLNRIGFRLKL
ncbi:MAG TPA: DUF5009 domain-containing protein [Pirellulales bacterium]|nr:DUF5009 domain-containing protein [Pirellulales bacterium]